MSETSESVKTVISEFHNYGFQLPEGVETPINKKELIIQKRMFKVGDSFFCPSCKLSFSKFFSLKRHLKNQHNCLLRVSPPASFPQAPSPSANSPHKCDDCKKYFKSDKSAQAHHRRIHKRFILLKKHKCPLCPESFEKRHMGEHFEKTHDLLLKPIKVCFDSYEEFCEWKKAIERVTKNYFTKLHSHARNGAMIHMFSCHRSGTFKSINENKRKLKAQGSKKIDAYCPAAMKVIVTKEGNCEVAFQSQHLGHETELQHLSLTYEDRKYIVDKLATNLPLDEVLKDIHNFASQAGFERLALLTRKDLHNIKTSLFMEKQLHFSSSKLYEDLVNCLRDIHNKHTDSTHVKADIARIEIGWVLKYVENNEIFLIRKMSDCDCPLICTYCKICIKKYICSCTDSAIEGNMCKHIHFFHMEVNKIHDVPEVINDCMDSNSNSLDCSNDSVDLNINSSVTEVVSNPEQSEDVFQTSKNLHIPTKSSETNKSNTIFIDSEKRNTLKNKFSDLINSITTEEEYRLFESTMKDLSDKLMPIQGTMKDLSDKLKPIQGTMKDLTDKLKPSQGTIIKTYSKAEKNKAVITAIDHPTLPGTVNKNATNQNNSNSSKTEPEALSKKIVPNQNNSNSSTTDPKALILQINDPSTQEPKYFYILAQQNELRC